MTLTHIRVNRMDEFDVDGPGVLFRATDALDGFKITDVDGLGPVEADVRYTDHVMVPGAAFNGTSINTRNIVIQAEIHPDYGAGRSVKDLRRQIYLSCETGTRVRVRLYTDGSLDRRIDGYVESVAPVIFSKEPSVQISIICTSPYFRAPENEVVEMTDLPSVHRTFNYDSEVPWGLELTARPNGAMQWIRIEDYTYPAGSRPRLEIRYPFQSGQRLSVSTVRGNKTAELRRISDGAFIANLIGNCRATNGWPQLRPGVNQIRVRGPEDAQQDPLTWDIRLVGRYAGY